MTGPRENVKIFGLRPLEAVAGLVPGGRHCVLIMAGLGLFFTAALAIWLRRRGP